MNTQRLFIGRLVRGLAALLLALLGFAPSHECRAAGLAGEYNWIHDPSRIIKCKGKYYVYYSGINVLARSSTDLVNWKTDKPVLERVPEWARKAVPAATNDHAWAPDVIFLDNTYYLFYSFSTFGSKVSVTGLVTSPTLDPSSPDYKWTDKGVVLASNTQSDFNAIDPAPILDEKGDLWMSIGSWNEGGIKLVKLDKQTGKPLGEPITVAAGQRAGGPEAPYLLYRDGYYYLFINEGTCCDGMNVTYHLLMGRSKSITGPYLDREGRDLAKGGGSSFLGTNGREIGPGHIAILSEDGVDRFSYHYYDGMANGVPTLGLRTMVWNADGWPQPGTDLPAGRYVITSKASGLALGVQNNKWEAGTPVDQAPYQGGRTQQWNLSPTGDGYYSIGSLGTAKYFDLFECNPKAGTGIVLYPWRNNDCQKWRIEAVGEDTYRILSKGGGTALTLPGGTKTVQAAVQGFPWNGDDSQQWIIKALP